MQRRHLIAIPLMLLVAVVFFEVPSMDFVQWDDEVNVYENRHYRLLPVLGLLPFSHQDVTSRFMNLPMLWAALALAWIVQRWPERQTACLVGGLLAQMEHWDEAASALRQAAALRAESAHVHAAPGAVLMRTGEEDAALVALRRAVAGRFRVPAANLRVAAYTAVVPEDGR